MVEEAVNEIFVETNYNKNDIRDIIVRFGNILKEKIKAGEADVWRGVFSIKTYERKGYTFETVINGKRVKRIVKGGRRVKLEVPKPYRLVKDVENRRK